PLLTGGVLFSRLADPAVRALYISVFQTGWFVESMWTQTLVIYMLRTLKLPFVRSRASAPVTLLTFAGIGLVTLLSFRPLAASLDLSALPCVYFAFLAAVVAGYMEQVTHAKTLLVRRLGELQYQLETPSTKNEKRGCPPSGWQPILRGYAQYMGVTCC